jgi:hypothetical protein
MTEDVCMDDHPDQIFTVRCQRTPPAEPTPDPAAAQAAAPDAAPAPAPLTNVDVAAVMDQLVGESGGAHRSSIR